MSGINGRSSGASILQRRDNLAQRPEAIQAEERRQRDDQLGLVARVLVVPRRIGHRYPAPLLVVVALPRLLLVRVDLDRQALGGRQHLHQERQRRARGLGQRRDVAAGTADLGERRQTGVVADPHLGVRAPRVGRDAAQPRDGSSRLRARPTRSPVPRTAAAVETDARRSLRSPAGCAATAGTSTRASIPRRSRGRPTTGTGALPSSWSPRRRCAWRSDVRGAARPPRRASSRSGAASRTPS